MTGRPSTYTPEIAAEICERLSEGEPLRQICRDDHMPAWRTVYAWIERDAALSALIARARELGYDAIAEEALHIADTPEEGVKIKDTLVGREEIRGDMIDHRKLRVETRLKLLAKWSPKKYGDKSTVDLNVKGDIATRLVAGRKRTGA